MTTSQADAGFNRTFMELKSYRHRQNCLNIVSVLIVPLWN